MKSSRLTAALCLLCTLSLQAQNSSPYWSLAGNSNASTFSKLGTTNSIPLRLFTNNQERLRIDAAGNIGIGTTVPTGKLHVVGNQTLAGNLSFTSGSQSIRFANPGSTSNPMIYMYSSGFSNYPRMVIAHSPSATNFGLQYTDVGDRFDFVGSGISRMSVNLLNGNIGIGINNPASRLEIRNPNTLTGIFVNNNFIGNDNRTGVYAYSVNNPGWGTGVKGYGGAIGVYGVGEGASSAAGIIGVQGISRGNTGAGARYGVFGSGHGGEFAFGIYGVAQSGVSFNAAGYFEGAVWASSYHSISDRKFKEGIIPLDNSLKQLMKVKPVVYQFKTEDFKRMHLPTGKQIGLIADEVKSIFPELVEEAVQPAKYDDDKKTLISSEIRYEGINYQGFIPVLIASVQELKTENDKQKQVMEQQQQQMNEQQQRIEKLEQLVYKLSTGQNITTFLSGAELSEVSPNPVRGTASIRYIIPEGSNRAQLLITDALGRSIRQITLSTSGVINVDVASLASGLYNYSLIVDNKTVANRKMTVVK
jgi:hypothetical protein